MSSACVSDFIPFTREAAALIRDVALAVQYAHEKGVVHRDLKPSNILLAPRSDGSHVRQNVGQTDGHPHSGECGYAPRITDFGLAKVTHADHSLTETGQILGTPSYMPPEQASGLTHIVGPAADIYSLGGVLYACLTGRPPFQAASVLDTVKQVLERDPVSLRDLNAAIPQDLETICLKCLEKSIPRCYPTAKAIADELQRYLDGHPIEARPVSRVERVWRWCRRNPVVASLTAGITTGGPWWSVLDPPPEVTCRCMFSDEPNRCCRWKGSTPPGIRLAHCWRFPIAPASPCIASIRKR